MCGGNDKKGYLDKVTKLLRNLAAQNHSGFE